MATFTGLTIWDQVGEQRKATHAAGLVQAVLNADTAQVPGIVAEMTEYRKWADPLLRQENDKAAAKSPQKLHASVALLPVDESQVDYLYGRLLDAAPQEVPVIRDALAPHKDALKEKLWAVVATPTRGHESQRLRAAAALAKYDPESKKWETANSLTVNDLVLENAVFLGQWSEAFRPVRNRLLSPLSVIFRDHQPERSAERKLATNLLADYAADQPEVLANLLMDADEQQFVVLYRKVEGHGDRSVSELRAEIDKQAAVGKERLAKRQANAAVALLRMNQPEKVWPLLKHSPDPRVRSYLIHRLSPMGADAGAVVKRLDEEPDLTIRRALILSLGAFKEKISVEDRKALLPKLQEMYRTASDPGLHAASEWLLRTWKEEAWLKQVNEEWAQDREQRAKRLDGIKQLLTREKEKTPPQWYVNGQGQTMVVIPGPVEFLMGSPTTEAGRQASESQHKKRIGRTFALAAKSVTVGQYRRYDKTYTFTERYAPTPDCPVVSTSWYHAAAYCNWLSKSEGIDEEQRCYEIKGQMTKLKANYLSLAGYRLPTEAEMEYATRAGALTTRYYGETDELLPKYAWYVKNSQERTWPVGSLKPNDLGLFDMQGNAFTWCQDSFKSYPTTKGEEAVEDQEDSLVIVSTMSRRLRGGSFSDFAPYVRSASRGSTLPTNQSNYYGFRVARTLPLGLLSVSPLTPKGSKLKNEE